MTIVQTIYQIVFCCLRFRRRWACLRIAVCAILVSAFSSPLLAANTTVRMDITYGTNQGTIDIELYDDLAPKTVANFLRYAGRGFYSTNGFATGFFHRSAHDSNNDAPLTIRAGGYWYVSNAAGDVGCDHIPEDPPIANEFSLSRSNIRGTITMGKKGNDPDSATSEWLINLANNGTNSLNLDYENGGYTVFGRVVAGMDVADAIGGLPHYPVEVPSNFVNVRFDSIPLINYDQIQLVPSNLVTVTRIPNVKSTTTLTGTLATFTADVDMIFSSVAAVDPITTTIVLAEFSPPPHKTVHFNDGIVTFTMTGAMGPTGHLVTLLQDATTRPTHYYAYGSTADNASAHWYDFTFDAATGTGAEIVGDKILLHFVDGQRGDDDLAVNNSITHIGAPVLITDIDTGSSKSPGCSIAAGPSQSTGNSDWVVISLFLTFVALGRKRTRRDRIQRA